MKSILATALAAVVAFSSCSKDDNGTNPVDGGDAAKLNVSFKLPQTMGTRATQPSTSVESDVNTMSVYIFDASGVAFAGNGNHFVKTTDFTETSPGTWALNAGKEVATKSGAVRIYVGVNVPAAIQAKTFATEAALLAEVTALTAINNSVTTVGFTMFSTVNSTNLLPASTGGGGYVNDETMSVDRVVSKLVSSVTDTPAATDFVKTWTATGGAAGISAATPVITFTYDVVEFGVYQEAVQSYLAKNPTTVYNNALYAATTVSPYATSVTKANGTVATGHEDVTVANRNAWDSFYISEHTPAVPALNGNTTYAMIATTVEIDYAAEWDTTDSEIKYTSATYGAGSDDVFIVTYEGYTFVTNTQVKASDIKVGLDALDALGVKKATIYTYEKGYVHFRVWLNKYADNDYRVGRNEFIHVRVNAVNAMDGIFPGYQGVTGTPNKPVDPNATPSPTNPTPTPPVNPIDGTTAALNVEITINEWEYMDNNTILQ